MVAHSPRNRRQLEGEHGLCSTLQGKMSAVSGTPSVPRLQMRGITKRFGGVQALSGVDFTVHAGEVHGLLGGNGAGKSTLIKVLTGVHPPDAGTIEIDGRPLRCASPREVLRAGIATIYQEVDLVPELSLGENLLLGRQPRGRLGLSWRRLFAQARAILGELELEVDPRTPAGECSLALQQLACIARAVHQRARLLVMDEPTSSLDAREVERVFAAVRTLRAKGLAVVFVTHFLAQVEALCDRVTVLRDGRNVATTERARVSRDELVLQMLGRRVGSGHGGTHAPAAGDRARFAAAGLELHAGEVLGLAGLLGSGRSTLARRVFAALRARGCRVAYCPEDRRRDGLFLGLTVRENLALLVPRAQQAATVARFVAELGIVCAGPDAPVHTLSGGNQQKVILARWLATRPEVLILDEPTRGIDVGAKAEIERLVAQAKAQGLAVLFVSADLDEVERVADRVLEVQHGQVVREVRA